jgi:hypothetical protein
VFVPDKLFQTGLMFASKERLKGAPLGVGSWSYSQTLDQFYKKFGEAYLVFGHSKLACLSLQTFLPAFDVYS